MIRAPYSEEFMAALLPIVDNPQVTASLRAVDGSDPVSLFIGEWSLASCCCLVADAFAWPLSILRG